MANGSGSSAELPAHAFGSLDGGLELFRTWGVSPAQVTLTWYAHRLGEAELAGPVASGQGIFAGGNSLRDYETLLEAVAGSTHA